jgi:hypothetical protein
MIIFIRMIPDLSKRYWSWILPLCAALWCIWEVPGPGDFLIFLSAADDLGTGINIFEKKYLDGYHYYYSVLFGLLLKPFTALPYYPVKYFWLLLNALLFLHLLRALYRSPLVQRMGRRSDQFVLLCFIASLRFYIANVHTSQITIVILWLSINGLKYILQNRYVTGSFLLALGINIKLLPLVFLPYLIYRGYFKATALIVLFYAGMLFLPSFFIGHDYNMTLIHTWLSIINPQNQQHILDVDERSFHSLSTLLSTLLVENVPDMYAMKLKRNIADIPLQQLATVITCVRLALIGLTLYFLRRPGKPALNGISSCFEISYILLLIPLIFPHQQYYAFLFAMPAFAILLYAYMSVENRLYRSRGLLCFLIIEYIVFNIHLLLGAFAGFYDHYKLITYAAVALIPALMAAHGKLVMNARASRVDVI